MLQCKTIEIRDRGTFIPAVAVNCCTDRASESDSMNDEYLLRRAGYGPSFRCILLTQLSGGRKAECEPYMWADRTMQTAHEYIEKHWDVLESGAVVDVEHILGERSRPKTSERIE